MYEKELAMVNKRWQMHEGLKRMIFKDLRVIAVLVILTLAIPGVAPLAMGLQVGTLLIVISFAKWIIRE